MRSEELIFSVSCNDRLCGVGENQPVTQPRTFAVQQKKLLIPNSALLTQKKGMITMTDTRETDCSETSCKDDLMQGLMALFAQADAAEAAEDDASAEE